jgi:hypothetical protein
MGCHFKLECNLFISVNVTVFQRIVPVLAPLQSFSDIFMYAQFYYWTIRMQRINHELWVFGFPKLVPPIYLHLHLSLISTQILWISFGIFSYFLHNFIIWRFLLHHQRPISLKNPGNHKELPCEKKFTMWSCASNYHINGIWPIDLLIDSCVNCTMPPLLQVLILLKIKCLIDSKLRGNGTYLLTIHCVTKCWLRISLQVLYVPVIKDTQWLRVTNGQWHR